MLSSQRSYRSFRGDKLEEQTLWVKQPAVFKNQLRIPASGKRAGFPRPHELASLKNLRTAATGAWTGLDPDDTPLVMRDVGTQEIYALDVDFPWLTKHLENKAETRQSTTTLWPSLSPGIALGREISGEREKSLER